MRRPARYYESAVREAVRRMGGRPFTVPRLLDTIMDIPVSAENGGARVRRRTPNQWQVQWWLRRFHLARPGGRTPSAGRHKGLVLWVAR